MTDWKVACSPAIKKFFSWKQETHLTVHAILFSAETQCGSVFRPFRLTSYQSRKRCLGTNPPKATMGNASQGGHSSPKMASILRVLMWNVLFRCGTGKSFDAV